MLNRDAAQRLLDELAKDLEFDRLAFDDAGTCTLVIDGSLFVDVLHDADEGALELSAVLGAPPAETAAEVHRRLLEANALWRETGGLAFALDPGTGSVIVQRLLRDGEIAFPAFRVALDRFVEAAQAWAGAIAQEPEERGPDETPPAGPDPLMLRV